MDDPKPEPLGIPPSLVRDVNNKAEFMSTDTVVETEVESRPAKTKAKANGATKPAVKAAGKPKVKAAPKPAAKVKTAPKASAKAAAAPKKAKVAKPKAESKVEKDVWGFRKGSSKSDAAAMYARKSGATLLEVKEKLGSVQLNCLVSLEAEGYEVIKKKEVREGQRPVTRYFLKSK